MQAGDTAPRLGPRAIERHVVRQATLGKQDAQGAALRDIAAPRGHGRCPARRIDALKALVAGASPDEVKALRRVLFERTQATGQRQRGPRHGAGAATGARAAIRTRT